jgi:hypothetical protein
MNNLEQLAALLFDTIVNLDPQEFDSIAAVVARFKTEDQASYSALMHGGCREFATLFGAIEQAAIGPLVRQGNSPFASVSLAARVDPEPYDAVHEQ